MFRRAAAVGIALLGSSYLSCAQPHPVLQEWGNGFYRPRTGHPEDILNFTNFSIKTIRSFSEESAPSLRSVAYGRTVAAGIDTKGDIFIWPQHEVNNVALEEVNDSVREIRSLQKGGEYVAAAFTKGVLFALNKAGEVWQWRFDKDPDAKPRKIPSLSNIVQIATGEDHFAAVDRAGKVWTMGDDSFGQCGIAHLDRQPKEPFYELRYPNPTIVPGLPAPALQVVCGKYHTLAVLENGDIYGWGRNNKRQLGTTLTKIGKAPASAAFEPFPIQGLEKIKIVQAAAGDLFSMFVAENGEVFGCGVNTRGQLALGYLSHVTELASVTTLSNFVVVEKDQERQVKIKKIECGAEHCIALLDVGAVYTWGGNEYGEQGNKRRTIIDRPVLQKQFHTHDIQSVFAQGRNCAVISTPIPPKPA